MPVRTLIQYASVSTPMRRCTGWVTIAPFLFLATNTLYGGFLNIRDNFYPKALSAVPAVSTQGWVLTICTAIMMVLAIIVLVSAFARWSSLVSSGGEPVPAES